MQIGVMRVRMTQGRMLVPVRMRLADGPLMRVSVVRIVPMAVLVLKRLVPMLVLVAFGEMHP